MSGNSAAGNIAPFAYSEMPISAGHAVLFWLVSAAALWTLLGAFGFALSRAL
jgi:hypothetical protein